MQVPEDLKYTTDHEWVKEMATGIYQIGITDFAQDALGDVVFVEVKEIGTQVKAGEPFGEAESTKSVSDLYAPLSGTIKSANPKLADNPGLINADPYGEGWMCEISSTETDTVQALMDAGAYKELVDG